jgi:hypothetical protein
VFKSLDDIPDAEEIEPKQMTEEEYLKEIEDFEKGRGKGKTNKNRRTFVVSATLGKSFSTSRIMNRNTKRKFKKLMKENPEVLPNMKLREIMHKIKFKNKTKVVDMTKETILPDTLELMRVRPPI